MPDSGANSFKPGDAFHAIPPEELLPRLRVDPAASPVDLMQTAFSIYIDGVEHDVDLDSAFDEFQTVLSITDHDAVGYVISRSGDWWHHWANDAIDEYILLPEIAPRSAVQLLIDRSGMCDLIQDAEWSWQIPT
jgi:hypothetical protein